MREFLWVVSLVGAVLGLFSLVTDLPRAEGAPQQAAGAALAIAFAAIPYVLARSWEEIVGKPAPGKRPRLFGGDKSATK